MALLQAVHRQTNETVKFSRPVCFSQGTVVVEQLPQGSHLVEKRRANVFWTCCRCYCVCATDLYVVTTLPKLMEAFRARLPPP